MLIELLSGSFFFNFYLSWWLCFSWRLGICAWLGLGLLFSGLSSLNLDDCFLNLLWGGLSDYFFLWRNLFGHDNV